MNTRRVAVVTGGNKGIGFSIVKHLFGHSFDGDVILTARDVTRGQEAIKALNDLGYKPLFHQLDIDDNQSINDLRQYLMDNYGGLDVLVNNAAIAYPYDSTAPVTEQAANTLRTNFFSTRSVCEKLLPILRSHARVVNLSSALGMLNKIKGESLRKRFADPNLTDKQLLDLVNEYLEDVNNGRHVEKGWPNSTYAVSKVAVTALTFIQQRQLNADKSREDIVVNAVHPGYVDTDMTRHKGVLTPEQGADAPAYLALLPPNCKEPIGAMVWLDRRVVNWFTE
ncbi:carbonyl reductase [NADPH] 3-like [Oppia nitens]|uniref:carbonyl reductase [NADPH] 3-like n=1 Tax=Oppia nitens TaxID=1686743 RepID=UPI0023D9E491|nr:carbonyl reductase [NADPH] 3-like [Oppia nitens]